MEMSIRNFKKKAQKNSFIIYLKYLQHFSRTAEGLGEAIQGVVDTMESLIRVTQGMLEYLDPLWDAITKKLVTAENGICAFFVPLGPWKTAFYRKKPQKRRIRKGARL